MKTFGWLSCIVVWVVAAVVPVCSAAMGPISSVVTDSQAGSPKYDIRSVTVGSYTVDRSQLATGTSTKTLAFNPGSPIPELDDMDLSFAFANGETGNEFSVHMFNGELWRNSNGDNPDFFLFEAGTGDAASVAAILPGGVAGRPVTLSGGWGSTGCTNRGRSIDGAIGGNNQNIVGICWAITDLLDQNGNRLTNDSVIEGIACTNRAGMDPAEWFAVVDRPYLARGPRPEDEATDVVRDIVLTWQAGWAASQHIVYFGTNFDDVNNGAASVKVGPAQDANSYDPPGLLDLGQTYYWRVDEVNNLNPSSPWKGSIWSFTVEPVAYPIKNITATASGSSNAQRGPEKTIDGSGLNAADQHSVVEADMWLSSSDEPVWIQYEFDKAYKLSELWVWNFNTTFEPDLGYGFKDVTVTWSENGAEWKDLGDFQFAQGPASASYDNPTVVPLGGVVAKYIRLTAKSNWSALGLPRKGLSEVRFFSVPVLAREPDPASGSTGVSPEVTLSWRAGREAASHLVYVGTDQQAVIDGTAVAVSVVNPSHSAALDLSSTYYWRVDEVNDVEAPSAWQGDVWSFSTSEYLAVDDFESYNDIDPPDAKSQRIFESWIDGFAVAANGALVGYDPPQPSYAEKAIVHDGKQSMPLFYSNTSGATYSEVKRTFATSQDWTKHGIVTLVLYFYGTPGNTGQLYVKVNNAKVAYPGDAADIARPLWKQWNIDLASLGIALQSVTTLSVGIDGNAAAGTLYVDDIRLYRLAPQAPQELIWIEAESGSPTAPLVTVDDPTASGGKYISTEDLGLTGTHVDGIATYRFTVRGGVYKLQGRVIEPAANGNSFWVRLPGATLNTTPAAAENGWMNWGFPAGARTWQWSELANGATGIRCTLAAGTYTLEIAYREDGARLDAIVITD